MYTSIKELIEARVSVNHYDPERPLSDDEIVELVQLATRAPSAYHFQNWKFIAVRTAEARLRLKDVCYGQQKVVDAPVTFIICGTLGAHARLQRALQPSVDAGIVPQAVVAGWVDMATRAHEDSPALQRDEAIRSASLAAMTLMLAAQGMGLSSGAMGGFDAAGVAREFALGAGDVPVILVTVGHALPGNWPQKLRKPLHEVVEYA